MPSMIHGRSGHSLVAVRSKLFVIGGGASDFEVYDSVRCKKFVAVKPRLSLSLEYTAGAVLIGSRIVVLKRDCQRVAFYDVDEGEWSEGTHESGKDHEHVKYIRIPQM